MSDEKNVTKPEHFELFQRECLRLWALWKVSGWRLECRHQDMGPPCMAGADSDPTQHRTRIFLSSTWPDHTRVTEEELLITARHEAVHALLGPLSALAGARFVTESEMLAAEHEVLNVLEGVLPR